MRDEQSEFEEIDYHLLEVKHKLGPDLLQKDGRVGR